MKRVSVKQLANSTVPVRKTIGAAGYDLAANECRVIEPFSRKLVGTGIALAIPCGFEGQIRPRSGLCNKHGITVLNSPGTIDSDYRGEVKVLLYNTTGEAYSVHIGDRIAQLVFDRHETPEMVVVNELPDTQRGMGGFGSTDVI